MRKRWLLCCLPFLAACAGIYNPPAKTATLERVTYADLPGWNADRTSEAVPAFARSCAAETKKQNSSENGRHGKNRGRQAACKAVIGLPPHDDVAARAFFERYFEPYAVAGGHGGSGLFTGYYEPELRGSLHRTKRFRVPLYERPRDLVTVDLGRFRAAWKGQHIAGKVTDARLVPYDDRAAIQSNGLKSRARVLLWVDDPADAFFLEIQGSGRVRMADGRILRVGYDGANGRQYTAIGRVLADLNAIERPVTMQKIRRWLAAHPGRAQQVMNFNASYVFFRKFEGNGPAGAEGVALTPRRSLAVDPAYLPLGAPVWLDTADAKGTPLQRLVVAQDTGGAIKGPVRGDVFWGAGREAETEAGAMQSKGRYFILLPKAGTENAGE